jgi:hypothetical protein
MPQIPDEKYKELATIHQNWLEHPMTTLALQAITIHKQEILKAMEQNALNSSVSNEMLRAQLYASKSVETVITMLKDFSLVGKRLEIEPTTPQQ